jgi:Na+/melibiose symporter-like transporter
METLRYFAALIAGKQIALSLAEFVCFVLFISLCLLFQRHRLGLFITYCFVIILGICHEWQLFCRYIEQHPSGITHLRFAWNYHDSSWDR